MSQDAQIKIGLMLGDESDWPQIFVDAVARLDERAVVEMVKVGGTFMGEAIDYSAILDRVSHKIPYYRAFLKHAAMSGTYVINNPFVWDTDSKFLGIALIQKLGLKTPRTVVLPNKDVNDDVSPDMFRNLAYPMNWEAIVDYVGVPAIFKDIHSGGRQFASRVRNVDELIRRYDESGTRTTILQEVIESEDHLHAFVIGGDEVMILRYSHGNGTYQPGILSHDQGIGNQLARDARRITGYCNYDVNMVEFVIKDDIVYVINSTNPAPDANRKLMTTEHLDWFVSKLAAHALSRARKPVNQHLPFTSLTKD